jgi:hypothetical protein
VFLFYLIFLLLNTHQLVEPRAGQLAVVCDDEVPRGVFVLEYIGHVMMHHEFFNRHPNRTVHWPHIVFPPQLDICVDRFVICITFADNRVLRCYCMALTCEPSFICFPQPSFWKLWQVHSSLVHPNMFCATV